MIGWEGVVWRVVIAGEGEGGVVSDEEREGRGLVLMNEE